jgi:hypothetical protein
LQAINCDQGETVKCTSCGHENPNVNRFCGMCGSVLDRRRLTPANAKPGVEGAAAKIGPLAPDRPTISGAEPLSGVGISPAQPRLGNTTSIISEPSATNRDQRQSEAQRALEAARSIRAQRISRLQHELSTKSATPAVNPQPGRFETAATTIPAIKTDRFDTAPLTEEPSTVRKPSEKPVDAEGGTSAYAPSSTFSMFGTTHELSESRGELHGPSFLGLSGDGGDSDYLLEDEEGPRRYTGVVFLVVLVLAGLVVLQWQGTEGVRLWGSRAFAAISSLGSSSAPKQEPPKATEPVAARSDTTATEQKPEQKDDQKKDDAQASNPAAGSATDSTSAEKSATASSATSPTADKTEGEKPASEEKPAEEKPAAARSESRNQKRSAHAKPSPSTQGRDDSGDELVARAQDYLYGRGGRRNCQEAMSLLTSAANQGNARASGQLGAMYATGNCAPFDRATAYRWLTRAATAEPGNAWLRQNRDMVWREMTPDERNRASR